MWLSSEFAKRGFFQSEFLLREVFRATAFTLKPLRLLPAGAATVAGRVSHPLEYDAFARRTEKCWLDESTVLIGTSDNSGIELAIGIALFKHALAQGEQPDWENSLVLSIGTEFRERSQRYCSGQGVPCRSKYFAQLSKLFNNALNLSQIQALSI